MWEIAVRSAKRFIGLSAVVQGVAFFTGTWKETSRWLGENFMLTFVAVLGYLVACWWFRDLERAKRKKQFRQRLEGATGRTRG